MRFSMVIHESETDFVVGINDEVEDVDAYMDSVLHGAIDWSPAFDTIREAVEWRRNRRQEWTR